MKVEPMFKNVLRSVVAFLLLGTVASFALVQESVVTIDSKKLGTGTSTTTTSNTQSPYALFIQAGGANGRLVGKGYLKIARVITYPMTVTAGTISFATATTTNGGGTTGGATSTAISSTATLSGFIKPRTGAPVPYVLIVDTTGTVGLTITGGSALTGTGKVKIEL
jgi:hypothetical protein